MPLLSLYAGERKKSSGAKPLLFFDNDSDYFSSEKYLIVRTIWLV